MLDRRKPYLFSRPRVARHQPRFWPAGSVLLLQIFDKRFAIFGSFEAGKDHFRTGHELSRIREVGIEGLCVPNVPGVLIGGGIGEAGDAARLATDDPRETWPDLVLPRFQRVADRTVLLEQGLARLLRDSSGRKHRQPRHQQQRNHRIDLVGHSASLGFHQLDHRPYFLGHLPASSYLLHPLESNLGSRPEKLAIRSTGTLSLVVDPAQSRILTRPGETASECSLRPGLFDRRLLFIRPLFVMPCGSARASRSLPSVLL